MTSYPSFDQVVAPKPGDPAWEISLSQRSDATRSGAAFDYAEMGESLPSRVTAMSVRLTDSLNGEAATAGFSVVDPDTGYGVDCWVSARIIDGQLHVRSWAEGAVPVVHKLENPNPRWFAPTTATKDAQ